MGKSLICLEKIRKSYEESVILDDLDLDILEAYQLLDEDLKENRALFPTDDMLKNCEVYQYLGEDAEKMYNELWKSVKSD